MGQMRKKSQNNQIFKAVMGMQRIIGKIDKNTDYVKNKVQHIEATVIKHEQIIYGNPEKMGAGGLLHTTQEQESKITGLGSRMDYLRSTFVMIWTGIFALIQLAFSAIKHFFSGSK
jgi:hypothetical protein